MSRVAWLWVNCTDYLCGHWGTWLGEPPSTPDAAKACLKTVEGVRRTMSKEERAAKSKRAKPTVRDPGGLNL